MKTLITVEESAFFIAINIKKNLPNSECFLFNKTNKILSNDRIKSYENK